jgi:hypothetical protein
VHSDHHRHPDWLTVDGKAYVLHHSHVTGVGGFDTVEEVRIRSVAATQVMVEDRNGEVRRVRRRDMTLPRTAGRYTTDDVLVGPGDLRVRRAKVEGSIAGWSQTAHMRIDNEMKRITTSRARVANDPAVTGRATIAALEQIRREAQQAIDNIKAALDLIT